MSENEHLKLAERVNRIFSDAAPMVSYLEKQLAPRGLLLASLDSSKSLFFDEIYLTLSGTTEKSNGYVARISVTLKGGETPLSDDDSKLNIEYRELVNVEVPLLYGGKHIVTLLVGKEGTIEHRKGDLARHAARGRIFSEASPEDQAEIRDRLSRNDGEVNFLVIPEGECRLPRNLWDSRVYKFDEVEGLEGVDKRVVALHKAVGHGSFYCTVLPDFNVPLHHFLIPNPMSDGDGFKNGVDALCRIIDTYPSLTIKELQSR